MRKLIAALAAVLTINVFADTWTDPNTGITWTYTISNGEVSVGKASPCAGAITVPSTLGGYSVTSIGNSAFYRCRELTSITIPDGVMSIGKDAFYECNVLESVTLPTSVTSIRESAFWYCSKLASVTIPSSVRYISERAFEGCRGLTSVTIPEGVTSIGKYAFYNCSALTSVAIPASVTSIANAVFYGCSKLTSVTIPEGMTSIGSSAFENCSGLTSVTIPSTVVEVINSAFWGCSGLTKVTIPAYITNKQFSDFFPQSVNLTSVIIGEGAVKISSSFFTGCVNLKEIVIPASVTKIENRAFSDCVNLLSVEFKGDAPDCGDDVFDGTPRRLVVSVPNGSIGWDGGFTTDLPEGWCGRAIVHSGESYDWDSGIAGVYLTATNVVIHYVVNSVMPEDVKPPMDADFVSVLIEVKGGSVSVPQSWSEQFPGFTAKFGSDFGKALTMATGKTGIGGAPMLVWQDYVAGTDPTNPDDKFTASITFDENNKPIIGWSPELKDESGNYLRKYTVYGKSKLNDVTWTEVKDDAENYNFFKVTVEMP